MVLVSDPSHIARCAQLAMLLEVSATPKPGNIDREHDYKYTRFEHFLASAVGVYPVLEKAARSESGVGALIHEAVTESNRWQRGGNTHFGAFLLLIPLVMAAGRRTKTTSLKWHAKRVIRETTVEDAVEFYRAFSEAKVKVKPVNDLDLRDIASIEKISKHELTLFDLMEISSRYDMIADEWVNGFRNTFGCAGSIRERLDEKCSINDAIVLTFMSILSHNKDTFIETKFGSEKAVEVFLHAKEIMWISDNDDRINEIRSFDEELLKEGINPGSTADIIIAGLFVSLFEGMRF